MITNVLYYLWSRFLWTSKLFTKKYFDGHSMGISQPRPVCYPSNPSIHVCLFRSDKIVFCFRNNFWCSSLSLLFLLFSQMKFIGRILLVSNYEEKGQNEYFGWRYLRSNDHWMVIHRPDRKVGHCLMLCWQSGRFQIQRSVVRIQSAAKYLYFLQIRLYWDNLKKWFQKMGHSRPIFLIFVFSIQLSLT